jgi:hypothetical protein
MAKARPTIADGVGAGPPLYARVLGARWEALAAPLQRMHSLPRHATASGLADIERGEGAIAGLIAAVVGFPRAGRDVPVEVRFVADGIGERWERSFAGHRLASYQFADRAAPGKPVVCERFGPITVALRLDPAPHRLDIEPIGWRCLGIPLPRALMPIGETYEAVDEQGRFRFHVEIAHPWFGLVVRYRGYLVPHA